MVADNQKRFRKRGGAKKKKKKTQIHITPPVDEISESPQPPSRDQQAGNNKQSYFSAFAQATTSTSTWAHKTDPQLQSYLEKLQARLEEVDPGAEAALAYPPGDEDPPESVLLSRNALKELCPRLPELSRDNHAARFIEVLLRTTKSKELLSNALDVLLSTGPSRVADLASHRCASHVLETLLKSLRQLGSSLEALNPILSAWTAEEIMSLITSLSGSHVFRATVAALSGLPNDEPREAKLDDTDPRKILTYLDNREPVSEESLAAVTKVANTLLGADLSIHDMLWKSNSSAALQGLLSAVTIADKTVANRLAEKFLEVGFSNLVYDPSGSRFVERVILCLGTSLVANDVRGHLAELIRHPNGNFVVQRYLLGLKGRGAVMIAWDELEGSVASMLGLGKVREGVVLALLRVTETQGDENCRRRASRAVAKACGAVGAKIKGLTGILTMGSEETWTKWKQSVQDLGPTGIGLYGRCGDVLRISRRITKPSLLGTLIARCMMRFPGGPGQATRDSMAALTNVEILALISDACGSRLVEQWIQDEKMERSKKIASKIFSVIWEYGESSAVLAVTRNPYGAMIIVRCRPLLGGRQQKQMMDALASDFDNLKNHESGQMVTRKCRVEHYMRKGEQWEQEESVRQTRQRLFAEIFEEDSEVEDILEKEVNKKNTSKQENTSKKRKRGRQQSDVISPFDTDAASHANLQKKAAIVTTSAEMEPKNKDEDMNNESTLTSVISAIEAVGKSRKKRKRKEGT